MAGDSLLANYQPGEVIHELVIDSRRGGDISLPRWQDHSECKFRVNITCFSLLCPDWCDYSATLLNARKVTFSALSVYSRQLASSHPWWWESAREEQKTFKESYFLCSFQTPACWPPPPLPSPPFWFFAGASPLHQDLSGSRLPIQLLEVPGRTNQCFPFTNSQPSLGKPSTLQEGST